MAELVRRRITALLMIGLETEDQNIPVERVAAALEDELEFWLEGTGIGDAVITRVHVQKASEQPNG